MFSLHWTEYFRALGPTLVAVFVAYIAYQQWRLNSATLRERLFERRWQIYKETQSFLSEIGATGKMSDDALWSFTDTCQRARFLLSATKYERLMSIRKRALHMQTLQDEFDQLPVGKERSKLVNDAYEEKRWLSEQLTELYGVFRQYLTFKETN